MDIALSIPEPLFQAAEQYAQEQGLSRDELYARALQLYLRTHRYLGVTEALDQIYAQEQSEVDPALAAAQARMLPKDDW